MGLDNGIFVKKNALTKLTNIEERFSTSYDTDSSVDVTYWRKCWGLRNDIIEYLCNKYDVNEYDIETFKLDIDDINKIISIVSSWRNKKKWNNESNSIWTWKEIKDSLVQNLIDLTYLLVKMEDYPGGFEVYFYDSY